MFFFFQTKALNYTISRVKKKVETLPLIYLQPPLPPFPPARFLNINKIDFLSFFCRSLFPSSVFLDINYVSSRNLVGLLPLNIFTHGVFGSTAVSVSATAIAIAKDQLGIFTLKVLGRD